MCWRSSPTPCATRLPACSRSLPGWANTVIGDLLSELHRLDERIAQYDRHIAQIAPQDARARRLMQLPGIGATTATAVVAMIGNGHEFRCGRQFAAWLGLTPGQYSSGGKSRLGRITKAGDSYLRSLLILGARSVLALAKGRSDAYQQLGAGAAAAARLLARGGGHCLEERAPGLGGAAQGRELHHAGVVVSIRADSPHERLSVDEHRFWTCVGSDR